MSVPIKTAFAKTIRIGPFVDETDGHTPETGLTINQADIRLSKDGGNFAQKNETGGATHDENGWYSLALNGTDLGTTGSLLIAIDVAGALPLWREFAVWTSQAYNSFFGTDRLQVDVQELVNATQSAADLKDFADAGYDPATNKVEGAKTVDTLTGHTPQTGDSYAEIGTAGAGLTDLGGMSTGMKAEVESEVDDALLAYDEAAGVASEATVDAVQADVTAIKAKTDNLPADPTSLADMKDSMFNRDVVTRHANEKPSQYTAGTGGNQETIDTTQDGSGNTETETKA